MKDFAELELDEEGTRISLTVVDTPGFGDQIDNEARYISPNHHSGRKSIANIGQLFRDCRIPRATIR